MTQYWKVHRLPSSLRQMYQERLGQIGVQLDINKGLEAVCVGFGDGKSIWFATTQVKKVTYCDQGRRL